MEANPIMPTYFNQLPVAFAYGRGAWLWDEHENQYLDSLSGIAVCSLGHAHPAVTKTITEQAAKLLHTSNTFNISNQVELAKKLNRVAAMEQAYFCNSGAEANEAAIKLARVYARKKGIAHPIIITMRHSFHGRTMATLSASGSDRLQAGFEPLLSQFIHVDLNNIEELDSIIEKHKNHIIAIMLEPIQGDGGVHIASQAYLQHVRDVCNQNDWLMILDEVQTGIGRTGKWFCHQHFQIKPDVMTVAKALGNGVPIAACLAQGKACNLFGPGKHGSTFGGNPFVCAVGVTVIDTIENDNILANTVEMGDYLVQQLKSKLAKILGVIEVRGKGLMLGIELNKPCMAITNIGLKHKILFNVVFNKVIRLLPPLIINKQEADEIVNRVTLCIEEFYRQQ